MQITKEMKESDYLKEMQYFVLKERIQLQMKMIKKQKTPTNSKSMQYKLNIKKTRN